MKKILVVGAGPCGLMASYQIKKNNPSYQVILLDKDEFGKRIKVSGNGRCNFSNINVSEDKYYNGELIKDIIDDFKINQDKFYQEINLHYYHDDEGRCYPLTNSSKTVLTLLINALKKLNVEFHQKEEFISYKKENQKYVVTTSLNSFLVDKIVFAIGGISYLYKVDNYHHIVNLMNVSLSNLKPSLCPLIVKEKINQEAIGKRSKARVSLYNNNQKIYEESGEVLFKKDGISGIVIFNLASYLVRQNKLNNPYLKINFIENISKNDILHQEKTFSKEEIINSYVISEIGKMIDKNNLYDNLSSFILHIKDFYPFSESQVTHGGILLNNINLNTLSLKNDSNIFVGGELLDVDALCGGYNIFFAFACGYKIGKSLE